MTKDEAIQFFRDACASKNTYKMQGGYGPGGFSQFELFLPESKKSIACLITLGWYEQAEYNKGITDLTSLKVLIVSDGHFELEATQAQELRSLWVAKAQANLSPEYARTRF